MNPAPDTPASKVLIVEDEMIVQLHLQTIVSSMGHEVIGTAASADEAFAAAEMERPDLVLMDIHLAQGNDGVETARTLRERHDCAVVFITANADTATVARTAAVVPGGFVVKPFKGIEVRAAITTAIASHAHVQTMKDQARSLAALVGTGERAGVPERPGAARPPSARRHFGLDTRLLVYSHDTFGLGHLRRSLALIRRISDDHEGVSTLLVSGSPMAHRYALPARTDYVKLPAVRKVAHESYEARSLAMSDDGIHSMRSNLLLRTVQDFEPDVLLVDHSPTGMRGELQPALEWLSARGGCTRILGLRDIIDSPENVAAHWQKTGMQELLTRFFEHIVVYGHPIVFDTVREYGLSQALAARSHSMHYVVAPPEAAEGKPDDAALPLDASAPLVVVGIGGGDGGAETVILPYLQMLARHRAAVDFQTVVLMGPFVDSEMAEVLLAQAQGLPVVMRNFVPSPPQLFARAELIISTAGYNSTTEILAFGKRAILVPRVMHRKEQQIRAQRLHDLGLLRCLLAGDVTPERLFSEVRAALASPEQPLARAREQLRVPLDGAERFSQFCAGLTVGR